MQKKTHGKTIVSKATVDTALQVLPETQGEIVNPDWTVKVKARIDERAKMLAVIIPPLEAWRKRKIAQLEELKKTSPIYDMSFNGLDDWKTAMFAIGSIFRAERKALHIGAEESKALLAYIWRVTFEFSTPVGQEERKDLIKAFGLDDNATHSVNSALLKKLNALQHRPLVVAESIMLGIVSFKFDETLASFVRQVVSVDKFTYTDVTGNTLPATEQYMSDWITANWEAVKGVKTKSGLMALYTDMGNSLSLSQQADKAEEARKKRILAAVNKAIASPDGRAIIDTITSLSADNKALACQEYDKAMLARGLAPIRPGAPMYYAMRIIFGKFNPTVESLEHAVEELAVQKAKLEVMLTSMRQGRAQTALVPAVQEAVREGIVQGRFDNGQLAAVEPTHLPVVA